MMEAKNCQNCLHFGNKRKCKTCDDTRNKWDADYYTLKSQLQQERVEKEQLRKALKLAITEGIAGSTCPPGSFDSCGCLKPDNFGCINCWTDYCITQAQSNLKEEVK